MKKIIRDTLRQMLSSNERIACELEGGAFCATFELPHADVPWVQAKTGAINLYYPFDQPPDVLFRECNLDALPSMAYPSWNAHKFATITFGMLSVDEYAIYIDRLFRELFRLPSDYRVNTNIFDMRWKAS